MLWLYRRPVHHQLFNRGTLSAHVRGATTSGQSQPLDLLKSRFGVPSLDFLGHHVDASGIRPLERAIRNFPQPTSQRKLREFVGLVKFYRRFIPHYATLLQPLNLLLFKPTPKPSHGRFISFIKDALVDATLVVHPVIMTGAPIVS